MYRKYGLILSDVADEFNKMDFWEYCPSEVIDQFWSTHNWKSENLNIFDIVLLAKGKKLPKAYKPEDIDQFLRDFASFMIASHTVHCLNRDERIIGRYMYDDEAKDLKEEVRMDFISRLIE